MMNGRSIKITTFPRLHLGLIGMNNDGYRINGGIGFSIKEPQLHFEFISSNDFAINDSRVPSTVHPQAIDLLNLLQRVYEKFDFKRKFIVNITGDLNIHCGFGSGTISRLALLEGLFLLNDYIYSEDELVYESGRGGTSGIGIRTYFHGGYVLDIGVRNTGQEIRPSNAAIGQINKPLVLDMGEMPDWSFGICIPKFRSDLIENNEKKFFLKSANVSDASVRDTLYEIIYGVWASVKENDLVTFSSSVKNLQRVEWKAAERNNYVNRIDNFESILYDAGATAVGMSSLGAALFFVSPDIEATILKANPQLNEYFELRCVSTNNSGRRITNS